MRLRVTAGIALIVLVLPLGAGARPQSATWQRIPFPSGWNGQHVLKVIGWESGRVWVHFDDNGGFRIVSAKVVSGRLSSFVTTPVANPAHDPWLNGNSLVWGLGFRQASMTAPLLANGHLGPATPLPGDPEGLVAQAIGPTGTAIVLAGVNVGSRTVWAVNGGPNGRSLASLMVCCSAAGAPSDLTSLLVSRQQGIFPYTTTLGRDAHGRIWIAWGDTAKNYSLDPRLTAHLVQLDPTTLAVVHSWTYASIVAPTYLVCSDTCRVATHGTADVLWTAGKPPVKIAPLASLRAAGGIGNLTFVTIEAKAETDPHPGTRIVVHRASSSGAGGRIITSVATPTAYPFGASDYFYATGEPAVAITPAGTVAIEPYVDHLNKTRVYSTVLR